MSSSKIILKKVFLVELLLTIVLASSSQIIPGKIETGQLQSFKKITTLAAYQNKELPASQRARDAVNRLTFEEVLSLIGGDKVFYFPGVSRLRLRPVLMADASQGLRLAHGFNADDYSTSFPCMLAVASTWNPGLAELMGRSLGQECRAYGVDILLGPGINFQRFSVSGRNFEYMGEDPVLTSVMAVGYIKGLQSEKVIATGKHFIGNDQEFCRHVASSDIDERTLNEIYLVPWKAVIQDGGVKAIMTGNNAINSTPCSMDKNLVQDVLRDEYGFAGMAMTDWQNTNYFTGQQYLFPYSGVSLLMPNNNAFKDYLERYIERFPHKKVELRKYLDQKVYENLLPLFETGIYDRSAKDTTMMGLMPSHKKVARKVAEEAICLLRNEADILPVAESKNILLMGEPELHSGVGSGFVKGYGHVDFYNGLKKYYGKNITEIQNPDDRQIKAADVILYRLNKEAGEGYDVPFELGLDENIARVAALNSNVVVVVSSCNGLPMPWLDKVKGVLWSYFLGQERGNALAAIISGEVNPSGKLPFTIEKDFNDSQNPTFNYIGGEPYWAGDNKAYKEYWKSGEQDNDAAQFQDNVKPHQLVHNPYSERIFMGYRWYDKQQKEVVFPFGYGLSYTGFEYSKLLISDDLLKAGGFLNLKLDVKNTGSRDGAEVVQLYISDIESSVDRPEKELKYFQKVFLKKGETKTVQFAIYPDDLAFWDVTAHAWKIEPGTFELKIGASSRDIRMEKSFRYK